MTGWVTGWKLPSEERERLLERFPPKYKRTVADHVTLNAGASAETPLPRQFDAEVVGRADDGDSLECLVVAIGGGTIDVTSVDDGILGGLVLQVGNMVMDASLRNRLEKLRKNVASAAHDPKPPVNRYQGEHPGELIHIDVKKLARIDGVGHRITGDRRGQSQALGNLGNVFLDLGVDCQFGIDLIEELCFLRHVAGALSFLKKFFYLLMILSK